MIVDWMLLLLPLQEAVGRQCSRCHSADSRVFEVELQLKTLEQTLQNEREICDGYCKYIDDLESNLNIVANDVTKQVTHQFGRSSIKAASRPSRQTSP